MTNDRRLPGASNDARARLEGEVEVGADRNLVHLQFEGDEIPAREGESVATALLAAGVDIFSRGIKYHRARGPSCMTGRCSNCLMRVDGEPNVFTCRTPVREGLKVSRQNAFPSVELDVFRAIDWFYPRGLDHHEMFAGIPVVEKAVAKVAREMAGMGTLPDADRPPLRVDVGVHDPDVLVVGAGLSGLAAARAAADAGARTLLVDENATAGVDLPSALGTVPAVAPEAELRALKVARGAFLSAFVVAAYRDDLGRLLLPARAGRGRLHLIRPRALVVATGSSEPPPAFENNDLPGVFSARALARLVARDRVLPGKSALIDGTGPEAVALAALLERDGCEVVGLVGVSPPARGKHLHGELLRARGRHHVAGAVVLGPSGETRVRCELIAVADRQAPLFDLARQAGAGVRWSGDAFQVMASDDGATSAADVFACGEVIGHGGSAAEASGRRAGVAAAGRRA